MRSDRRSGTLSVSSVVNGQLMLSTQPEYAIKEEIRDAKACDVLERALSADGSKNMTLIKESPDSDQYEKLLFVEKTNNFHTQVPSFKRETRMRDVPALLDCRTVEEAHASLRQTFNARGLASFNMRLFEELTRDDQGPWDAEVTAILAEAVGLYEECGLPEESLKGLTRIVEALHDPRKPEPDQTTSDLVSFLQDYTLNSVGKLDDPLKLFNTPLIESFDPVTVADTIRR